MRIGRKDNRKHSVQELELKRPKDRGLLMYVCAWEKQLIESHLSICIWACVCLHALDYIWECVYVYLYLSLSLSIYLSLSLCVCLLSLFKQVESFSLQDLPCALPGKNFFCSAIDFCICYKFRKHFTTQPKMCSPPISLPLPRPSPLHFHYTLAETKLLLFLLRL